MPKVKKETSEPVETKTKSGLVVYADFAAYRAGDVFVMPADWKHDADYEELLLTKAKKRQGMVFQTATGRVTVPVMEA